MFKIGKLSHQSKYALSIIVAITITIVMFQNCSLLVGSMHSISDGSTTLSSLSSSSVKFTCNANAAPNISQLQRLSKRQYVNTVRSIISRGLNASDQGNFSTFFSSAGFVAAINAIPEDGIASKGNSMVYDTADQRMSVGMVNSMLEIAMESAQWISSDPNRLSYFIKKFGGAGCASETINNFGVSKSCYDQFITGFGLRALRRPLITSNSSIDAGSANPAALNDLAFYESVYLDSANGGFDSLIAAMLMAPDALFLSEFQGAYNNANTVTLNSYELAAKLSYYFTDMPPDEILLSAAATQFQGSGYTLQEQIDRLFVSQEAHARMNNFFSQWLRPYLVPNLNPTNDSPQTDLVGLRTNAIQEMVDLTDYYTFGAPNGKLSDIATSPLSFAKTSDLANLYGVGTWKGRNADGSYDPASLVRFSSGNPHAGIFTRAGFAFSGGRDTNLIIRGARIRRDFLCYGFAPPANVSFSNTVATNGPPTMRNLVAANTEVGNCMGCHKPLINPIGNALENYDSFGRFRTVEPLFNDLGVMTQSVPVNANSTPQINLASTASVTDGIGLSQAIGDSVEFNSCFVRHYFRFSEARTESDLSDGCELQSMLGALTNSSTGSLQSLIKTKAKSAAFQSRQIRP